MLNKKFVVLTSESDFDEVEWMKHESRHNAARNTGHKVLVLEVAQSGQQSRATAARARCFNSRHVTSARRLFTVRYRVFVIVAVGILFVTSETRGDCSAYLSVRLWLTSLEPVGANGRDPGLRDGPAGRTLREARMRGYSPHG